MGSQRNMRIGGKHSGAMRSLIGGKMSGEPTMRIGGKNNS